MSSAFTASKKGVKTEANPWRSVNAAGPWRLLEEGGGPCQEVLEKSEWGLDTWAGTPVPVPRSYSLPTPHPRPSIRLQGAIRGFVIVDRFSAAEGETRTEGEACHAGCELLTEKKVKWR